MALPQSLPDTDGDPAVVQTVLPVYDPQVAGRDDPSPLEQILEIASAS